MYPLFFFAQKSDRYRIMPRLCLLYAIFLCGSQYPFLAAKKGGGGWNIVYTVPLFPESTSKIFIELLVPNLVFLVQPRLSNPSRPTVLYKMYAW